MTTNSLTKNIEKLRTKISKGNFKSGEESKLHMKLDGLRRIRNGLERLEKELENLNNN
tara:strand:- start:149 stop:322 length:174 start_codon:yes stop_codon:yes gene_type:complete